MKQVTIFFQKIEAERLLEPAEPIKPGGQRIEVNTRIEQVEKRKVPILPNYQAFIKFIFTCRYPSSIGLIRLTGYVIHSDTPDNIDHLIDTWRKSHRLPESVEAMILNGILGRSTVEAVGLSKILQIPPPIPLPGIPRKAMKRKEPGKADFSHYI